MCVYIYNSLHICVCVYVCTMYVCVFSHVYMWGCVYVPVYVFIYVCMGAYM